MRRYCPSSTTLICDACGAVYCLADALTVQLKDMSLRHTSLEQKFSHATDESKSNSERAEQAESALEDIESRYDMDTSALKSALATSEAQLSVKTESLVRAHNDVQRSDTESMDFKARAQSAEGELRRATARETAVRTELDKLADELTKVTVKLRRAEATVSSTGHANDANAGAIESLRKSKKDGEVREGKLDEALKLVRAELAVKERELADVLHKLVLTTKVLEEKTDKLAKAVDHSAEVEKQLTEETNLREALENQCT